AILAKNGTALSASFTSHDLRRSTVTHIAESLGIGGEPLIKRLLGHADGSVTAIYNRYGYMKEMRAALEAWARELTRQSGRHSILKAPASPCPDGSLPHHDLPEG